MSAKKDHHHKPNCFKGDRLVCGKTDTCRIGQTQEMKFGRSTR